MGKLFKNNIFSRDLSQLSGFSWMHHFELIKTEDVNNNNKPESDSTGSSTERNVQFFSFCEQFWGKWPNRALAENHILRKNVDVNIIEGGLQIRFISTHIELKLMKLPALTPTEEQPLENVHPKLCLSLSLSLSFVSTVEKQTDSSVRDKTSWPSSHTKRGRERT